MNRIDLQQLAEVRLREANALFVAREWSGAYYLAGYAVECALKACVARQTKLHEFPDKARALKSYSHRFADLLEVVELRKQKKDDSDANPTLRNHWEVVERWKETARYARWTENEAHDLLAAISHPTEGVLSWIKRHW